MKKNSKMIIEIAGYTDDKGSEEYNLNLSRKRAKTVMQYLIDNGINENRISSNGYGESKPITSNESKEGRELNRRVEFEIK